MSCQPMSLARFPGRADVFLLQLHRRKVLNREVTLRMEPDALVTKS